jgi:FixJ family two-component response regulator
MSEPEPIVLLVDDDANFRRAVHRLLKTEAFVVELFASAEELLKRGPLAGPGCILLDLQLPRRSGLDLQAEFVSRGITTPIVFLTGHGDVPSSVTAMKGGAIDFLTKPVQKTELVAAIREAFKRDRAWRAADAWKQEALARLQALTPRETDVLRLVVRGMLNKQIAAELGTSEATVKVHRGRVMQKMQVPSVAELVRVAEAAGVNGAPHAASSPVPAADEDL